MAALASSFNWVHDVFPSFSGEDVRVTFLSHFLKELDRKLIIAFKDSEIKRSRSLDPKLKQAIRDSRIAVVVFSENYASSSWCLNELLEIVKCKEEFGQLVIPVFYGLDPSHVRKQTGDFGRIFEKTCHNKTEEVKNQWKRALTDVANICGYLSETWGNEAKMIEEIVNDVLGKLLLTTSKDSENLVGIEDHIAEMSKLLQMESEEVRMVGIWGSSGIGKTTIARALFNRLSRRFQGRIFIDRAFVFKSMEIYGRANPDDYNMKLHLQRNFFSEILGKHDIKIDHLDALRERLKNQKVLIFIDDLDDHVVLDALVGQTQWFGSGSRIIVVTNDKHLLKAHGIDHIYEVCRPSEQLALEMQEKVSQGGDKFSTNISSVTSSGNINLSETIKQPIMDQLVKELEEKLFAFSYKKKSRIVGIVGMPGIGKTTLAETYYNKGIGNFTFNKNISGICKKSKEHGSDWLKETLMNGEDNDKAQMFTKKILLVLDDVSHKDQVDFLLENRHRIAGGSKIIITTRDKSSIEELVDDIYIVPGLDDKEALQLFNHHAKGSFPELSKKFVEYAGGNPLALEELGKELSGKEEDHWKARLETLPHCCNPKILTELRFSYDRLSDQQKDTFLDIACFFRTEEEDYVKCLLDPYVPESGEAVRELAEKLLICISAGRIEMHNLLCTLGKELGSSDENKSGERMWNHDKTILTLWSEHVKKDKHKVRGIFLDTSKFEENKGKALDAEDFIDRFNPQNLRYLKIYDSLCPQQCEVDCKVNLPEGLTFPFQEIRYFHWLKFPLDQLPSDFNPKNLIDLRLPYSKIKRIWKATKETPQLKWVDVSFSTKLSDLSALSKAFYLRRLNLEGCTNLSVLPREMENMKSLVFLNLRGCVMLSSLPTKLHLISLKTLILSGCSRFDKFELSSENLEFLHLDGTAIKSLPKSIKYFQKLVLLNLKECKMLESLPYNLYKLKALEELILSGCALLTRFPDIKENMENLQILLLDGTSIEEVPKMLLHCVKIKDQVVCKKLELSHDFVGHLEKALQNNGVNVDLQRIEESRMALVILSSRYAESRWCLNELVKIKQLMEEGKLLVIPIFYQVEQLEVTELKGDFGVKFWNTWRIYRDHHIIEWKEALKSVASMGIYLKEHCSESEFITLTVNEVLEKLSLRKGEKPSLFLSTGKGKSTDVNKHHLFGMDQRMEQLEKKLEFDCNETLIIGVVGMPGIGKTTLAMMLHEKWNCRFLHCMPLLGIRKKTQDYGPVWLRKTLLEVLLEGKFPVISDKTTHASVKDKLLESKVFVVLDDVSDKKQLEFLLGDLDWIKKGSKIVITTSDKSLLEGFAHDTYVVPELNDKEAFQLFSYHAFDDNCCSPTDTFMTLSRMFVDYARGHPVALNLLGRELHGKEKAHWECKLEEVKKKSHMMFQNIWKFSTDQLNERQKDVFLDIVCFFKSEDEYFVRSLLDSGDPGATDSVSELTDLTDKFLIRISDGRVEMNDPLYAFSRDLGSPRRLRLRNYEDIINKLKNMELSDAHNVRGIFLDMSKLTKSICLDSSTFINMRNLLYLKIYDSCCPRKCKADCNLVFPEGLEFPLEEVRYLHWVKFPLQELPPDFRPENLVDLRLPFSKIERVWEGVKDTPRLKWVDLSHSSNLLELSALSRAENLQRLNLEGCTVLDKLPVEIQNMKSLIFLNLRGCTRLSYLPEMNLISLKTLILSDCSNLEKFQLISESLEVLHLDGTAIKRLPLGIKKLQKLVLLNLKNCKMLERLPNCLRELKALEELILSGCSRLENLSDVRENMKYLQSLLIDRIGAKEMPNISSANILEGQASADMVLQPFGPREWPSGVLGVCSLRRLCLSGNDFVSLQTDIGKLYNLNWLDVKECKMLRSIPMLPPRLQYFDAHGCDSLERVANPLALPVLSGQIHATFNFSNCNNLDQDAKDSIISYTRWKSQLVLDALSRYNEGSVMEDFTGTCFPGWEVPAWFSHQASGSVLKLKLPPHWCNSQFTGIAVCAVIVFPGYYEKRNHLLVKCNCVFNYEDGSHIRFSCTTGSWREPSNTTGKIEPSHVFIGYTSTLDIKKYVEEKEIGCSHTEASFEFEVTDGTEVLEGCVVLQCGFSLVYATNERENICWDAKTVVIPERTDNNPGEARSYGNPGSRDDIQYESYSGMGPERDENFICDTKSDATKNLQKSFENKIVDLFNEESDGGREIIVSSDDGGDDPQARKLLGSILCGNKKADWEKKLQSATQSLNMKMRDVLKLSIDQLNERQKDVFLDIVFFFKSEDEYFVRSILDLGISEAVSEVRDLADKFLITISGGRVEMHDLLYTLAKDLGSPGQRILCNCKDIINKVTKMKQPEANNVRGIFLDMSEVTDGIALDDTTFTNMRNLRYLKIYDSCCPRNCKDDCKLVLPEGLNFPLEEVRYFHWVKYPLQEIPSGFRPENLVDMRLPYSKIERVWKGVKVTPRLKWVDLCHSSKLVDLTGLSKAENLQRLNLEGCTSLDELPVEIQNMKSLVFLNLRRCIRLRSLPKMNLVSLKTLILSDCSNLKEFQLISESVKFLYLDGTAIKGLPLAIQNLQRLVVLNLKNCKMLECLPNCLRKLKFLDELILSGCSRLKNIPDVTNSLKHLQILLLDGTGANEMPSISCFTGSEGSASADIFFQPIGSHRSVREWPCDANGLSSLRRLCLSGNDFVSLQPDIGKLYNLNWLDVKQCKKLRFVPTLPPRLQYFDANGCDSLERVANPLAHPVLSEQIRATFNFSNCSKLDQDAKDSIITYSRLRSQLMLDELTCYNEGFVLEALIGTCLPGWEIPAWFSHRASGSVLKPKLPPHWSDNRFTGIALSAVILFPSFNEQRNRLLVKCNCVFNNEDGSSIRFSSIIGSWREPSNTPGKIESSHVFIGYTSTLDFKMYGEKGCGHTEASFEFQVTDGTEVLEDSKVLKCGFSLVYATDDMRVKFGVRRAPVEANQYRAHSKQVAISNVRRDTATAETSQGVGHEIVELPNKIIAHGNALSPQPPITTPIFARKYGTGSKNLVGERHVSTSDADTRFSEEPQELSASLIPMVASSSQAGLRRSRSRIFMSFDGAELPKNFVKHLVSKLRGKGFSVFTNNDKGSGIKQVDQLYKRIEESRVALAIFTERYVQSNICLNELVMMDKLAKEGKLLVIPVFYNVTPSDVRNLKGEFGRRFKKMSKRYKDEPEKVLKWETSVKSITKTIDVHSALYGEDSRLVKATVKAVERALNQISGGNPKSQGGKNLVACIVVFLTYLFMSPLNVNWLGNILLLVVGVWLLTRIYIFACHYVTINVNLVRQNVEWNDNIWNHGTIN